MTKNVSLLEWNQINFFMAQNSFKYAPIGKIFKQRKK